MKKSFYNFVGKREKCCQLFITQSRILTSLKKNPLEHIVAKREKQMLVTSIFSFSDNVFFPSRIKF